MNVIDVRADMDESPWDHLRGGDYTEGVVTHAGLLRNGTVEGRAVLAMLVRLRAGGQVVVQIPLALARSAAAFLSGTEIAVEDAAKPTNTQEFE